MEISVHGIFNVFIVFPHSTNSGRTGTSGGLWDSLGYAWKDVRNTEAFFGGGGGGAVLGIA